MFFFVLSNEESTSDHVNNSKLPNKTENLKRLWKSGGLKFEDKIELPNSVLDVNFRGKSKEVGEEK